MDTWKECAEFTCRKRFEPGRRTNQFRRSGQLHEGSTFCSAKCRQKAYRRRIAIGPDKRPQGALRYQPATIVPATVTAPSVHIENTTEFRAKKGHARPPKRLLTTRAGKVVPDAKWPGMYRIQWRGGALSDMVNYTRAAAALRGLA